MKRNVPGRPCGVRDHSGAGGATLTRSPICAGVAREPPMTITLLGSGTPAPSLQRQGAGFLFAVGGDLIVIDHGPDAHHRLLQRGHRAVDVGTHVPEGSGGTYQEKRQ